MSIFSRLFGPRQAKSNELTLTSENARELIETGSTSITGKTVTETNLLRVSPVWSAIRIIAETIGTLPIHLYERTDDGRRRAKDHTLSRLIHLQPNPYMTSVEWREAMAVSLCVWGQAYNRVDRLTPGGRVTGIVPLLKRNVRAAETIDGELVYQVTQNGITRQLRRGPSSTSTEDILPIKGFGSANSLEGFPPYRYHNNAIGLAQIAEEFAAQFFADGARPSGLLLGDVYPSADQRDQLGKLIDKARRKLLILGGGFKYFPMSSTNEEAQLLQTRKMQIAEIARIWRVPLRMMMEGDSNTYNNTEQDNKSFLEYTLRPYLVRIEQAMNSVLLARNEQDRFYIEFDTKGLLRGDSKSRGEFYRNMRMISAMTPNEVREAENLPRKEGGDDLHVPLNMAPIDQIRDILGDDDSGSADTGSNEGDNNA